MRMASCIGARRAISVCWSSNSGLATANFSSAFDGGLDLREARERGGVANDAKSAPTIGRDGHRAEQCSAQFAPGVLQASTTMSADDIDPSRVAAATALATGARRRRQTEPSAIILQRK